MKKRIIAALLAAAILGLFAGCSPVSREETLLTLPKVGGDYQLIETTLSQAVSDEYTLKYPTAGNYRSAYVLCDLLGTGKQEFAVAFYAVTDSENVNTMHMHLMKQVGNVWTTCSDVQISAVGVEKVEFCDLDGDGIKEIVVGWNIYSGVEKKAVVYALSGSELDAHSQENYTEFLCCDIRGNGHDDLFVLNHIADKNETGAKVFSFENNAFREVGQCEMDGAVVSVSAPQFSKLSDGTPAVFVDTALTNGMQTEVLFFKDKQLVNPVYIYASDAMANTFRSNNFRCCDINDDGFLDIPLDHENKNFYKKSDANVSVFGFTDWCSFDGEQPIVTLSAAMNYSDGYFLQMPSRLKDKIVLEYDATTRTCAVLLSGQNANGTTPELARIKTVTTAEWDKVDNGYASYYEVKRSNTLVYIAMPGLYDGSEKIGQSEMRSMLNIIQN